MTDPELARTTVRKVTQRFVPILFLCFIVSFLDRVNVGFAALTMNEDLGLSATAFGLGAGLFFLTYFLFEVPSNLALERFGARRWIARIMFTWGLLSAATAFVRGAHSFYAVRLLLGAAEAGFFPGVIFFLTLWVPADSRARVIAMFMAAIPVANAVGSPISALLTQLDGLAGLKGWQWMFLIEALPALLLAPIVLKVLIDKPADAAWLSSPERDWLQIRLAQDARQSRATEHRSVLALLRSPLVIRLGAAYFGITGFTYGLSFFLPQIVKQFGLSIVQTGFVSAIPFVVGGIGMTWWGRRSDRLAERRLHLLLPLALAALGLTGSTLVGRTLFPLGAVCGATLAAVAAYGLNSAPERAVLPIGLPDLPMHLRLDGLSSLFLFLLGAASTGISLFAAGYFRRGEGTAPGLLCLQYHLFLASMGFVLLADDTYAFMVAWETMALSSYFLVTAQHGIPEIRRAGFLYLLLAHLGAIAILLSFGVMQGGSWQFTFDAMRNARLAPHWAAIAFLLALTGFGAKAGLVPLHVWLPEAHPAAPSPVSALMSGVMLKTAVYGVLRVTFDLLGRPEWWWGLIPLAIGLFSALYGVVFAAVQTDMKRLLAWSSIENLGIILTGIGLALVFHGVGMSSLAALALLAALYHCLNHSFIKSLLFLGTGAVLHSTGERNLGRLGGLIHRMPWVAWLTLVGALAMAGLPPLNGFVSEWLLLQSFLFAHEVPRSFINMMLPLGAALVALSAALAAYVMVKFFGVIFLGQPRETALAHAHDAGTLERIGLVWLAAGCFALGLMPTLVLSELRIVVQQLSGDSMSSTTAPWWLLVPLPERRVSYSAPILLVALVAVVLLTVFAVKRLYHQRVRRAPAWDCGFGTLTPRMQDTAEGFGQPIRHIFGGFFAMIRELPTPFDHAPRYRVIVGDRIWESLYTPLGTLVQRVADMFAWLQQGRISTYLLYSFATLISLLALML